MDSVLAAADVPTATRPSRLVVVALLVALPVAIPLAWLAGVALLAIDRPRGWRLTVAMCPGGFYLALWLYGHAGDDLGWVGMGLAALALLGCFAATHRILSR